VTDKTTTSEQVPVALEKAEIDRVDGVAGPANGVPFLIVKALDEQPDAAEALASVNKGIMHDPADPTAPTEIGEAPAAANAEEAGETPAEETVEETAEDVVPAADGETEGTSTPIDDAVAAATDAQTPEAPAEAAPAAVEAAAETPASDPTPEPETAVEAPVEAPADEAASDTPIAVEAAAAVGDESLAKADGEQPAPEVEVETAPVEKAAETENERLRRYLTSGQTVPAANPLVLAAQAAERVAKDTASAAAAAVDAPLPADPFEIVDTTAPGAGGTAWEADDAKNAQAAVDLALALKARLEVAASREAAEGEWDDSWDLGDAACAVDWILGVAAKYLVEETAEAGEVTKSTVPAASATLARLFAPEPAPVTETTEAVTKSADTPDPLEEIRKALENIPTLEAVTKSVLESPAMSDVLKSVVGAAVKDAVSEEVTPLKGDLEKAVERIATMEKQPMPGGPLLRGSTGVNADGLTLVVKDGQSPSGPASPQGTPQDLAKALETVTDPGARDAIGQALAATQHPLARRG
jgi:hypothetical protein